MKKVIIIYCSMTGNTEEMSEVIEAGVIEAGLESVRKDVYDASAAELLDYEGIIIGAYTWGDGDLPDEFLDFFEELEELDLSSKKAIVFGSGDTFYPNYCGAVDIIENKLRELGAKIVRDSLKFEYNATDEELKRGKTIGSQIASVLYKNI